MASNFWKCRPNTVSQKFICHRKYIYTISWRKIMLLTHWIVQTLLSVFQSVLEWSIWSGILFAKNSFELHIYCLKLRSISTVKISLVHVTHDLFFFPGRNCLFFSRKASCFLVPCGVPALWLPHIYSFYSAALDNFSLSCWTDHTFNIIFLQNIVIFTIVCLLRIIYSIPFVPGQF